MKSVRVWLEDDVQNTLEAAALSCEMMGDAREQIGFRKALAILAKAFGVPASTTPKQDATHPNPRDDGTYIDTFEWVPSKQVVMVLV